MAVYNAVKCAAHTYTTKQLGRFLNTAPFSKEHLLGRKPHFVVVTIIISNISLVKDDQASRLGVLRFLKWWQKGCEIWREIAPKMVEPWAILMKWPLGSKFGLPKLGVYCSRWNGKDSSHAEKNLGHFSLNFTESAAIDTSFFFFIEKPLIFNENVPLLKTSRAFSPA